MNAEPDGLRIMPAAAGELSQYATIDEVEKALSVLTDEDYAMLDVIARSFCKNRRLSPSVLEPKELLAEACAKTLCGDKRWNKRVSIIKHLDRAMENISGHVVRKREKIDAFPEGLEPSPEQRGPIQVGIAADEMLMRKEEVEASLEEIFGEDTEARQIFELRLQGFQAAEIKSKSGLSATKYEAAAKRIRRKIFLYLHKTQVVKNL